MGKGLLLRGVDGDRRAWHLPFDMGVVHVEWSLPFATDIPAAEAEWALPFDLGDVAYAAWGLPYDVGGPAIASWGLPFAILDAAVGYEDGATLAPQMGYFDPTPVTTLTYAQKVWSTDGIVGLWMLGGADPSQAQDSLGINHGVASDPIVGTVAGFIPGDPATATPFTGTEVIAIDPVVNLWAWGTGDFSIEWIMRVTDWTDDTFVVIPETTPDWSARLAAPDVLAAMIGIGTPVDVVSGLATKADGLSHHVLLSVDRDGSAQWYLDGLPDGSPTDVSSVAADVLTAVGDLLIGLACEGIALQAVALYSRALTPTEAAENAAYAGKP